MILFLTTLAKLALCAPASLLIINWIWKMGDEDNA